MIVVTVARKPFVGPVSKNVMAYGTGALDIGSSRIEGAKRWPVSKRYGSGAIFSPGQDLPDGDLLDESENVALKLGRFPSNFILQHSPSCYHVGEEEVSIVGTKTRLITTVSDGFIQFNKKPLGFLKVGHVSPQGTETVETWVCAPGCPVLSLDGQDHPEAQPGDGDPSPLRGVSRFYKKVGGQP